MGEESRALFQAMLMLFELLMAVFMEKRTTKHSRNSGPCHPRRRTKDESTHQAGAKAKGQGYNKHPLGQHPHGRDRCARPRQRLRDLWRRPPRHPLR